MPDAMTPDQRRRLAAAEAASRMLRASLFTGNAPKTGQIIDLAEWILYGAFADEVDENQEKHATLLIEQGGQ